VTLTVSNSSLKQSCSVSTSVTSALEVNFNNMRYINLHFTYLLTYFTPICNLMGTSTIVPDVGEPLKVNHMVWLAERQQPEVEVVDEGSYSLPDSLPDGASPMHWIGPWGH